MTHGYIGEHIKELHPVSRWHEGVHWSNAWRAVFDLVNTSHCNSIVLSAKTIERFIVQAQLKPCYFL